MQLYNAVVEVASKGASGDHVDELMDKLAAYHVAVGSSARGWVSCRISLPAESLAQACSTAFAVVGAAAGAEAIACEVMTEAEFLAREGWEPVPDLISVTEAGKLLGITRQAVLARVKANTLPATQVGRDWVIPRSAVDPARGA